MKHVKCIDNKGQSGLILNHDYTIYEKGQMWGVDWYKFIEIKGTFVKSRFIDYIKPLNKNIKIL